MVYINISNTIYIPSFYYGINRVFGKGKRFRVYEIIVPSVDAYNEMLIVTQNTIVMFKAKESPSTVRIDTSIESVDLKTLPC